MSYMIPSSDPAGTYHFGWHTIGGEQFDPLDPQQDLGADAGYHVTDLTGSLRHRCGTESEEVGCLYASVLHIASATPAADAYSRPDIGQIVRHHTQQLQDFCRYAFAGSSLKRKVARAVRHPDSVNDACVDKLLLIERVAVKPERQQHHLHLHLVTSFLRHFRGSVWDLVAIMPERRGDEESPTDRAPWSLLGFVPLPGSTAVAFPLEEKLPTHALISQRLETAARAASPAA
jgi:hypothetical protein